MNYEPATLIGSEGGEGGDGSNWHPDASMNQVIRTGSNLAQWLERSVKRRQSGTSSAMTTPSSGVAQFISVVFFCWKRPVVKETRAASNRRGGGGPQQIRGLRRQEMERCLQSVKKGVVEATTSPPSRPFGHVKSRVARLNQWPHPLLSRRGAQKRPV